MKLPQNGGCQCGALRYEVTQAPSMVYACHCTDCQRVTSSAFSMAIVLPADAFRLVAGEPRVMKRTTDSGRVSTRWVCPECGSWISHGPRPGIRNVRAGTLDDTSWLRPTAHFWTRSKQPWVAPRGCAELRDSAGGHAGLPLLVRRDPLTRRWRVCLTTPAAHMTRATASVSPLPTFPVAIG